MTAFIAASTRFLAPSWAVLAHALASPAHAEPLALEVMHCPSAWAASEDAHNRQVSAQELILKIGSSTFRANHVAPPSSPPSLHSSPPHSQQPQLASASDGALFFASIQLDTREVTFSTTHLGNLTGNTRGDKDRPGCTIYEVKPNPALRFSAQYERHNAWSVVDRFGPVWQCIDHITIREHAQLVAELKSPVHTEDFLAGCGSVRSSRAEPN